MSRGRVAGDTRSKAVAAALFVGLAAVVGVSMYLPTLGVDQRKAMNMKHRETELPPSTWGRMGARRDELSSTRIDPVKDDKQR